MIIKKITPEQQCLVIEDLYNSTDSISSTEKFNRDYGNNLGRVGKITLELNDFVRILLKTNFNHFEIDQAIKRATGYDVDLDDLI